MKYLTSFRSLGALAAMGVCLAAAEGASTAAPADPSFIAKLTPSRLSNPHKGLVTNEDGSAKTAAVLMCRIYGSVSDIKTKKLPNDDIGQALVGSFEGQNAATGEIKRSGVLYLPAGIQDVLVAAVKAQGETDQPIQFGLDLYIRHAGNPAGYEWDCKKVLKEAAIDPLETMRGLLSAPPKGTKLALPAPKAA